MSDFAHVVDSKIRSVLQGDVSEDALCYALHQTELAFATDCRDEMIPAAVLAARGQAVTDAVEWWNLEGDAFQAVESLKSYWSV